MSARNYSNTATVASLSTSVTTGDTSVALTSFAGFPTAPFTAAIERDTTNEEIVLVTSVTSSTVTMTRGYDGTTAKTHPSGAQFLHVVVAKDYAEANGHINASTGVHGNAPGSAVVGTTDIQTLTNKTLTSPTISNPTVTGTTSGASASYSGTLTVAGLTSLAGLTTSGNASVGGTLTVTGATTLAALTASSSHITGAATIDGNATVGGTLSVTGNATFSGSVSTPLMIPTVAAIHELYLEGTGTIATPGNANELGLWVDSADHGLYAKGHEVTAVRRLPFHWGAGTSFPAAGALLGDLFEHTGLNATMRKATTGWRQDGFAEAADAAARTAISTTYSSALHPGFRVLQSDTGAMWVWSGSAWVLETGAVSLSRFGTAAPVTATPKVAMGKFTVSFSAISFSVSTIDFTAAGFTETPQLFVSYGGENHDSVWVGYDDVTTTGATIVCRASGNITRTAEVSYLAIGR